MGSAWPLIGRVEELAAVKRVLADSGEYAGVVLAGDAGVGKSRLAREALAALSGRYEVRWVAATASARALPLGAFAAWISDVGSDPTVLVHGVIQSVTASEHGRPIVLGVDDAHLLDDLSAFVVHQLVHRRLARVVVTVRKPETPPEAITALWKDTYLQRVELQPLTRGEFEQLLVAVLDGPLDPVAMQRLWDMTRGNALFLRHLIDQERASGRLCKYRGMWSWRDDPDVFTTLGELIDAQMGALSEQLGEVVDLLAVGEPLDCEVLANLAGWHAVDEACAKGLVALAHERQLSSARLVHPLYGEVRRSRASPARLRRLRGRIVQALSGAAVVDAHDLIHRALLLLDSDQQPDAGLFTQAAGAALQLLDPALAERLAGAARDLDGNYAATMLHAGALHLVGQVTEAERVFANATDRSFTPEQRGNLAALRAGNLFSGLGLAHRANRVLDDAQARLPVGSQDAVLGFRAVMQAVNGPAPAAVDAANAVLASDASGMAGMGAYLALMFALGYSGRVSEVVDVAKRGYFVAEKSPDLYAVAFSFTEQHVQALILAGYQSEAEAIAERWERQTIDVPIASRAYAALFLGQAELGAGRVAAAREWLEKAMPAFTHFEGEKYGSIICGCDLVSARALSRDAPGAAGALNALQAARNPFGFLESRCALAVAWVAAAEGATTRAAAHAWRAADMARGRGHFAQEVICLQTATRFGDTTTNARLAELCDMVEGPRVVVAATHSAALAAEDADGLLAASEQFERMGDALTAADIAAQAVVICKARDRRGSALSARERADRLAEQCGPADTPALRALKTTALTDRQREILAMAAQGLSNRQIAERLNLSVRSVEGHRYRARKK